MRVLTSKPKEMEWYEDFFFDRIIAIKNRNNAHDR